MSFLRPFLLCVWQSTTVWSLFTVYPFTRDKESQTVINALSSLCNSIFFKALKDLSIIEYGKANFPLT